MNKKTYILFIIFFIIIIIFGGYTFFPGIIAKDCGAELSCIRAAFDNCSIAKATRERGVSWTSPEYSLGGDPAGTHKLKFTEYTEIRGPWIGGCRVYIEWLASEGGLSGWKDKKMNCLINPKNYDLTYSGLQKTCSGPLIDAFNPENGNTLPLN